VTTLFDDIDRMVARLPDELAELEAQRADLDSRIARLKAFQRVMAPSAKRSRPASRKNGAVVPSRSKLDPKRVEAVQRVMQEYPALVFTLQGIHVRLVGAEWSAKSTAQVFTYLRRIEYIGKMGKEHGTQRQLWRIIDAQ
jgi:ABC-type transporter Mla subunit MlaD